MVGSSAKAKLHSGGYGRHNEDMRRNTGSMRWEGGNRLNNGSSRYEELNKHNPIIRNSNSTISALSKHDDKVVVLLLDDGVSAPKLFAFLLFPSQMTQESPRAAT